MKNRFLRLLFLTTALLLLLTQSAFAAGVPFNEGKIPLSEQGLVHWQAPPHSAVIDSEGNIIQDMVRVDLVHYARPSNPGRSNKKDPGYDLLGVKWLTTEGYVINLASVPDELQNKLQDVTQAINVSADTWDVETNQVLFGEAIYDTEGNAHYGEYDEQNTLEFGTYPDANVIAVTSIWYNVRTKAITEYDILFNKADYNWSALSTNHCLADHMDLQNIATHEIGHAVGLGDVYNPVYNYVTMFGYSSEEELIKRDLAPEDKLGLLKIYGE